MSDVTRILNAINRGDARATDQLLPVIYEELRLLAAQKLAREAPGQTLQATALVHEAYIRLVGGASESWNSRGHFFGAAAEAMRRILVENARRKKSSKRGGGLHRADLGEWDIAINTSPDDLLGLNEALDRLAEAEPGIAEVVTLRYFAGLPLAHVAALMGVTRRTVDRHWALGRAWLYREVTAD